MVNGWRVIPLEDMKLATPSGSSESHLLDTHVLERSPRGRHVRQAACAWHVETSPCAADEQGTEPGTLQCCRGRTAKKAVNTHLFYFNCIPHSAGELLA